MADRESDRSGDSLLTSPLSEAEPKPLRERLMPQASLRFFLLLIGASAVIMFIFRLAFTGDSYWAKIVALLFTILVACFAAYATMFLLANLFAVSTRPIRSALGYRSDASSTQREDH